jgi:hypothetical protein
VADLRTRIAAVVADAMNGTPPERFDFQLADKIIADLGLKQVIDVNRSIPQSRWVTDWEAEK